MRISERVSAGETHRQLGGGERASELRRVAFGRGFSVAQPRTHLKQKLLPSYLLRAEAWAQVGHIQAYRQVPQSPQLKSGVRHVCGVVGRPEP